MRGYEDGMFPSKNDDKNGDCDNFSRSTPNIEDYEAISNVLEMIKVTSFTENNVIDSWLTVILDMAENAVGFRALLDDNKHD